MNESNFNTQVFWKVEKKICPNAKEPPVAMLDNLLTNETAIQERAIKVFTERHKPNEMKKNVNHMEETTNKLCEIRLEKTKKKKSKPWNIDDLEDVLKDLEKDKSSDALGYANKIFRKDVAGKDLKLAILKMMNMMKQQSF